LALELERKKATLAKLKNLEAEDSNKVRANITLQFSETGVNGTYLSLAYQIQAIESTIINTEESIKANQDWYNYYKGLIGLNERLLEQVKTKASSYYTIQQFHSFLATLASNYESKELIGYLNAYIKRIENMISTNVPLIEDPKIYPIPKGTFKKTLLAFVVLLMTATVTAFVAEGIQKDRVQAAKIAS
jgi:hypothetical protein